MLLRKQQLGRKHRRVQLRVQLWVQLRRMQLWRMQLQLRLQQQLHPRSLLLSCISRRLEGTASRDLIAGKSVQKRARAPAVR